MIWLERSDCVIRAITTAVKPASCLLGGASGPGALSRALRADGDPSGRAGGPASQVGCQTPPIALRCKQRVTSDRGDPPVTRSTRRTPGRPTHRLFDQFEGVHMAITAQARSNGSAATSATADSVALLDAEPDLGRHMAADDFAVARQALRLPLASLPGGAVDLDATLALGAGGFAVLVVSGIVPARSPSPASPRCCSPARETWSSRPATKGTSSPRGGPRARRCPAGSPSSTTASWPAPSAGRASYGGSSSAAARASRRRSSS